MFGCPWASLNPSAVCNPPVLNKNLRFSEEKLTTQSKLASIGSRSAWLGSRSEICPVRVDGIYGCELIDLILIRAHR